MSGFEDMLLSYLLNSIWQIPLLLAAALLAARLVRPAGPLAEHRVWAGAFICQAALPALSLVPWETFRIAWPWQSSPAAIGQAGVAVQMGSGTGLGTLRLSSLLMTVIGVAYVGTVVYFAARFAWRCARVAMVTRGTEPLKLTADAEISRTRWSRRPGIGPVSMLPPHRSSRP